jgi:paraquat-inducible protein B
MVEDPTQHRPDGEISEPEIRKRSRISIFWIIPLVTLLIAGGLGYKTLAEKGPLIEVSFESADGLEIGKTKVQYRGIDAGIIEDITVTKDLSKVLIAARMIKEPEPYLTEGSKLWVDRKSVV